MRVLHGLERWVQHNRSFVLPSHWVHYWRTRSSRLVRGPTPSRGPVAALDLQRIEAEQDGGRYLYQLFHTLRAGDYTVAFRDRYRFLAGMKRRRYKQLLTEEPFLVFRDLADFGDTSGGLFITDDPSPASVPAGWTRIDVSYDQRFPDSPTEISLPYGIHPVIHASSAAISQESAASGQGRWCRLFFAGQAQVGWYDRPDITRHFGLMNRLEVIETVRVAAGARFRSGPPPDAGAPYFPGFHLTGGETRISEASWLEVLRGADVFLACPGRTIPLAHSVVEALSVGAIPLLQHPDQFDPPLEDGRNALVFLNAEHLAQRTDEVLNMSPEAIADLRRGATEYYHQHLHPRRVVERLTNRIGEPRTTLLYNWFLAPKVPRF